VPSNSEKLVRLSEVLALVSLLTQRLTDLRPVRLESLASLDGRPARKRRRGTSRVDTLVKQAQKASGIKGGDMPLELVAQGLEEILVLGVPQPSEAEVKEALRDSRMAIVRAVPATVPVGPIQRTKTPVATVRPGAGARAKVQRSKGRVERVQEFTCAAATPFLVAGLTAPNPFVAASAAVGLLGCGFELIDLDLR